MEENEQFLSVVVLAIFQMYKSHMWLVVTVLESTQHIIPIITQSCDGHCCFPSCIWRWITRPLMALKIPGCPSIAASTYSSSFTSVLYLPGSSWTVKLRAFAYTVPLAWTPIPTLHWAKYSLSGSWLKSLSRKTCLRPCSLGDILLLYASLYSLLFLLKMKKIY